MKPIRWTSALLLVALTGCAGIRDFNDPGDKGYLDSGFAVTPDERYVVGVSADPADDTLGRLHLVDTETGEVHHLLSFPEKRDRRVVFHPDRPWMWFMYEPPPVYDDETGELLYEQPETWVVIDYETLQVLNETTFSTAFWGTRLSSDGRFFSVSDGDLQYVIDGETLEQGAIAPPSGQHDVFEAEWLPGTNRLVVSWNYHAGADTTLAPNQSAPAPPTPPSRQVVRRLEQLASHPGTAPLVGPRPTPPPPNSPAMTFGTDICAYDIVSVSAMPTEPAAKTTIANRRQSVLWGFGFFGMSPDGSLIVVPTVDASSLWDEDVPGDVDSYLLVILDPQLNEVTRVPGRGPCGFTPDSSALVTYEWAVEEGEETDGEVEAWLDSNLLIYDTESWQSEIVELMLLNPAYYLTPDGSQVLLFGTWYSPGGDYDLDLQIYDLESGDLITVDDSNGRAIHRAVITPEADAIYFLDWNRGEDCSFTSDCQLDLYMLDLLSYDLDRIPIAFNPYEINILPSLDLLVMAPYATPTYYFMGIDSWMVEMEVTAGAPL